MDDDRFYVKTLTLENFRCFEKTELGPFDPHFNLLVGENGSGKSSVLVALANLFRPLGWRQGSPGIRPFFTHIDSRNTGKGKSFEEIKPDDLRPAQWNLSAAFAMGGEFVVQESQLMTPILAQREELAISVPRMGFANVEVRNSWSGGPIAKPYLLVFYGALRGFGDASQRAGQQEKSDANVDWLKGGADVAPLREWFRDETIVALQASQGGRKQQRHNARTRLNLTTKAVEQAMPESKGVAYDGELRDIVIYNADGSQRSYSELSDGQRAFIGLVADLARRCFTLNGSRLGTETLRLTTGLVLIDEIDLHLHPKWQRQIVGALKKIFPKIQFFATTHSPQVIGQAKPEEIVLLTKEGKQKRPAGSFGMDSNWILECVMETDGRDPTIAKRIKALFDLIEYGRFDEARSEIEKLRPEIGPLAPDVVGAESYLWRIEHEADEAAE